MERVQGEVLITKRSYYTHPALLQVLSRRVTDVRSQRMEPELEFLWMRT